MTDHKNTAARKRIATWMRAVMIDKGWSANEWASYADTSATNITRVIGPGKGPVPNCATIMKLATIAGSQPQLIGLADPPPEAEHPKFHPECGHDLSDLTGRPRPVAGRR